MNSGCFVSKCAISIRMYFSSLRQIIPKAKRKVNLNDQKIPLNRVLSHVTFSIFVYALRRKVSETAPKSI